MIVLSSDSIPESELNQELKLNCAGSRPPVTVAPTTGTTGPDTTTATTITQPPVECTDPDDKCPEWADDGWCTRCSMWMSANCKRSCDTCDLVTTTMVTTAATTTTTAPPIGKNFPTDFFNQTKACQN